MKKIHTLVGAILLSSLAFAQTNIIFSKNINGNKAILDTKTKAKLNRNNIMNQKTAAAGPFAIQVDVVQNVMTQKAVDLTSANPQENIFITGLFQDSTVMFSSNSGTRPISDIILGTVLDPRSLYLQSSFDPIVSNSDSYTLDSLFILGSYVKKTAATDTLYTWVVWGDSTNTSVFTKMNNASVWPAPISTWRKSVIGPKVTGAIGASGNKVKAAAPASNMRLIKYVLKPEDSTFTSGRVKYKNISVGAPILIPAGSMVSAFYTFVPGGAYINSDCAYNLGGSTPQTTNGFAAAIWGQSLPAVTAVTDYVNYQVEAKTMCMGVSYDKNQRHAKYSATFNNNVLGDLVSAAVIVYSIYGNSSVGINELAANGATLGQNIPNPFNGESTITYQLAKDANSVLFTVTDVMGRVISSEKGASNTGSHSIKLGSYAAGIYYYTLNVDGKTSTKKMIAQ